MTQTEIIKKLGELYGELYNSIKPMSLKDLKEYIKNAPKRPILHELELNYRINGGQPPIDIVAKKMCEENQCETIHISVIVNFTVKK